MWYFVGIDDGISVGSLNWTPDEFVGCQRWVASLRDLRKLAVGGTCFGAFYI